MHVLPQLESELELQSPAGRRAVLKTKCSGLRWKGVDAVMLAGETFWVDDFRGTDVPSVGQVGVSPAFSEAHESGETDVLQGMLGALWRAVNVATSEWVAVVDGLLKPLPGATFPDVSDPALVMVCPAKQFALNGREIITAARLDAPGFLVKRERMKETLGRILAAGETAVAAAIEREAVRTGATIRVETLLDYGWQY